MLIPSIDNRVLATWVLGLVNDGDSVDESVEGTLKGNICVKATPNIPRYSRVKTAMNPCGSQMILMFKDIPNPMIHMMLKTVHNKMRIVVYGTEEESVRIRLTSRVAWYRTFCKVFDAVLLLDD